jgi:hypothetical protein
MITQKKHPETGETLFFRRRTDGGIADSLYVWESADGKTTLDATEEEDRVAVNHYNGSRSITDR